MNLTPPGPHFLDTSAIILMMRHGITATSEALVPFAALGELRTGMERVADRKREGTKIDLAIRAAKVIYPTRQTIVCYGRINADLQRVGRPVPSNDVWIAALALQWDLLLLADDVHFARVPDLRFIPAR